MSKEEILADLLSPPIPRSSEAEERKIEKIRYHFARIMETLGLDLEDDSLKETPKRVAKMYVQEIFSGLDPRNKPSISLFENKYQYGNMVVEKEISLYSYCEHHFVPIIGKAHVAYFPREKVMGLSKMNRLVQYYARRPQVQERLTIEIAQGMQQALGHADVAVILDADHLCVASRGIRDTQSRSTTYQFYGKFEDPVHQNALFNILQL